LAALHASDASTAKASIEGKKNLREVMITWRRKKNTTAAAVGSKAATQCAR
jgi:hypothetical protein